MAKPKPKRFEYGVSLDPEGRLGTDGASLEIPETWKPEHLVLAGLARCSLTSLRYHARRAGISVEAEATTHGVVTPREEDGRYAFVRIEFASAVTFDPKPAQPQIAELLAKAERDCFVGASLSPAPTYVWTVT